MSKIQDYTLRELTIRNGIVSRPDGLHMKHEMFGVQRVKMVFADAPNDDVQELELYALTGDRLKAVKAEAEARGVEWG